MKGEGHTVWREEEDEIGAVLSGDMWEEGALAGALLGGALVGTLAAGGVTGLEAFSPPLPFFFGAIARLEAPPRQLSLQTFTATRVGT